MGIPRVIYTYLSIGNDPEFSRSPGFAGQSTIGDLRSSTDGGTGRHPVANIARDDFNQGYSGIILGAIVFPIFEIAEERGKPGPKHSVRGSPVKGWMGRTDMGDQNFLMRSLFCETLAIPDTLAHPVVFWS